MKRRTLLLFAIVMSLICISGCGYHFSGSGSYPAGVKLIFVTLLENRTAETGVESTFTNDLIYEFTRNRKESLTRKRSSADGILSGTIARLAVANITRTSISTAKERRVTGTLTLRLESPDGRLLWNSGRHCRKRGICSCGRGQTGYGSQQVESHRHAFAEVG